MATKDKLPSYADIWRDPGLKTIQEILQPTRKARKAKRKPAKKGKKRK
jgi:hypothetical protein